MAPYAAIQYIRKRMGYDGFLRDYAEYRGVEYGELIAVLEEIQECAKEFPTIEAWFTHVKKLWRSAGKTKEADKRDRRRLAAYDAYGKGAGNIVR